MTKLSKFGPPSIGHRLGATLPANRITSAIVGNAASRSTDAISCYPFGMDSRIMSRLNRIVDLRLFFGEPSQFRGSKLASATYGDSRDAPCPERCDVDGFFGRQRLDAEIFGVVDLTSKIEVRIGAITFRTRHPVRRQCVSAWIRRSRCNGPQWETGNAKLQDMGL
ncbi:hypothetical protein [Mesorhizobium sp. ORS 3428]|uniref:hypothetical protein n=1 Tax=Mesorhizobium sp. ORS 3428 TaxID=540997 RepID=UPI001FCCF0D4|nr:hypothetical protein [Mesorhizobium sp. ORS 3428]